MTGVVATGRREQRDHWLGCPLPCELAPWKWVIDDVQLYMDFWNIVIIVVA